MNDLPMDAPGLDALGTMIGLRSIEESHRPLPPSARRATRRLRGQRKHKRQRWTQVTQLSLSPLDRLSLSRPYALWLRGTRTCVSSAHVRRPSWCRGPPPATAGTWPVRWGPISANVLDGRLGRREGKNPTMR